MSALYKGAFSVQHPPIGNYNLEDLKDHFQWSTDISPLLERKFDALVLTDLSQQILWVDEGFEKMTGYSPSFALGKSPEFLQGKETSKQSKQQVRNKLKEKVNFTSQLINYKKDGRAYLCEISIFPLLNQHQLPTHFLALENEIG